MVPATVKALFEFQETRGNVHVPNTFFHRNINIININIKTIHHIS